MMKDNYVLKDGVPVPEPDIRKWEEAFRRDRVVGKDQIGDSKVSTVFIGIGHMFETMVFGGELDGEQECYETMDEAKAGHAAMCARVRAKK